MLINSPSFSALLLSASANATRDVVDKPLSNGARLVFKRVLGAPRLAMSFLTLGGNMLDPVPGLSDLLDRLIMKGTTTRTQSDIALAIDGLTLEVDTDTRRDYSVMGATLLEEDLEASLALMADLYYNSTLAEFDREREKMLGEIQMDLDSPKSRASDQLTRNLFANTAYGITGSVLSETLGQVTTLDQLTSHYQSVYRNSRLVIVITGDLDETAQAKLEALLVSYFPSKNKALPNPSADRAELALRQLSLPENRYLPFERNDSTQMHIYQAWLAPELKHSDYIPLSLMNTILGAAGLSSRLFTELRDKQGLAYNVRSSLEARRCRGSFTLYIGTEPSNRQKCIDGFAQEIAKLTDVLVPDWELTEAKENMLGRRQVFLETGPQQASYLASNLVLGRTLAELAAFDEQIKAVTANDIQRVSQTLFSSFSIISAVGPAKFL
jgi:zinc protease